MNSRNRLHLIDSIRGMAIISMIGFHACWIMSYFNILITNENMTSTGFNIWQKSICITFILISGYSFSLSRHNLKNGLVILGIGVSITVLSILFLYDLRDVFGVLWILGLSQLIMILPDKALKNKVSKDSVFSLSMVLFIVSFALFLLFYRVNEGFLSIGSIKICNLPDYLYKGYLMTFLGFMEEGFYSVDYFSFFPWFFLYCAGYFLHKLIKGTQIEKNILSIKIIPFNVIGKYSLIIYLVHPVIIYIICYLVSSL